MTPSLQFSVPCLNIPEDEKMPPTFQHIFYELPSPEFPFRLDFFLANGWCNGTGSHSQEVRILKPDGTVLVQTGVQPFQLKSQTEPFMVVNRFEGVTFEAPGVYRFQVSLDGGLELEYPLDVRQLKASGPAPDPSSLTGIQRPQPDPSAPLQF